MAALSNILSVEPFAIPIPIDPFASKIHLAQLPIFITGVLGGPWAGLLAGSLGGLYMSFSMIPFVVGGLAILGFCTGYFTKKFRPFFSSILAWCVQAPYVFLTDYVWFSSYKFLPASVALGTVTTIMVKLTIEAVIASVLAEILVPYIKRAGLTFE